MPKKVLTPIIVRALEKVVVGDSCWEWDGAHHQLGYAQIREGRRGSRLLYAYRALFEFFRGPTPAGLDMDHLCRNPRCVKPSHVEPVTHQENVSRGYWGERRRSGVCKNGHPLGPRFERDHGCRTCMNEYQNERRRRLARESVHQ